MKKDHQYVYIRHPNGMVTTATQERVNLCVSLLEDVRIERLRELADKRRGKFAKAMRRSCK